MKKPVIILISTLLATVAFGQSNPLSIFDNLIGKAWKAEEQWENGTKFKQEVTFKYSLDSTLVVAKSNGFTNEEQTKYGPRNFGIRQYDAKSETIQFWEFDVFGGLTKGKVFTVGKNIFYQYNYGGSQVTDLWEYVNDSTYNFKIGSYNNDSWKQLYLETQFRSGELKSIESIFRNMKSRLNGNWTSKAWDGVLNENWYIDENGHLKQKAEYFENGHLLYEATNKIELIDNELILITVIKNNNPKIFKATSYNKHQIVFENTEYKNPNKVVYNLISDKFFEREISGTENDKPSSYTFKFEKMN